MRPEVSRPFSSLEALREGWDKTKGHLKPLLILGGVGAFLALLQQALTQPPDPSGMRGLFAIAVQVLNVALTLVFIRAALAIHDGRPFDLSRPGQHLTDFFSFLLVSVLVWLVVAVGFVLLIVPGVIWGLMFGFAPFLVAEQKLDPLEAMKESRRLTRGVKGPLLGFALLMFGVNLLGAIALGVGLLVTVPTTFIASAHVFRRLQERAGAPTPTVRMERGPQRPASAHGVQ